MGYTRMRLNALTAPSCRLRAPTPTPPICSQRVHEICSYKKLLLPKANSAVIGPVPFPCAGSGIYPPSAAYDACDERLLNALWNTADKWIKDTGSDIQPAKFKRKILLVPEESIL